MPMNFQSFHNFVALRLCFASSYATDDLVYHEKLERYGHQLKRNYLLVFVLPIKIFLIEF